VRALVFVDDFVGTGHQAAERLRELDALLGDIIIAREIRVVFAAVVGYRDGCRFLEEILESTRP